MKTKILKLQLFLSRSRRTVALISFRLAKWLKGVEVFLFHLTMWAIVACSFIGIIRRAGLAMPRVWMNSFFQSLDSVPFHYLLISAAVAASLALILPTLIPRIGAISFGGVKLALAQTETALDDLKSALDEIPPELVLESSYANDALPVDQPFVTPRLNEFQIYDYKRLSNKLFRIFDQVKDPNKLDFTSRANFRRHLDYVARAASAMGHDVKYLNIVLHFQSFDDRKLSWDEEYLIGHAYLTAADYWPVKSKKEEYWERAAVFLESARQKHPDSVRILFTLGVAMFMLESYEKGIQHMDDCKKRRKQISPWANWNIACAQRKQGRSENSLNTLGRIPFGPWWKEIQADTTFFEDSNDEDSAKEKAFKEGFEELCKARIGEYEQASPNLP